MTSVSSEAKMAAAAAEMEAPRKATAGTEDQELGAGLLNQKIGPSDLVGILDSFDIDHNGPPFSPNDTAVGEEQYDEESQIFSSYPRAMGEGRYDEEFPISSSTSPEIVKAISESDKNLAIDLNWQPTLLGSLQGCAGSYLIRGRNDASHEISQGNGTMEMNDPYSLNVEDGKKNMLKVPTKGDTVIQTKNSDSQEREHCLQMLEMVTNWSVAALIAIMGANLNGSSGNDKRAAMAVGRFGYAGVFFLSLLFKASRLFPSAHPLVEAHLKFIVGHVMLLFCLVTISLFVVLPA